MKSFRYGLLIFCLSLFFVPGAVGQSVNKRKVVSPPASNPVSLVNKAQALSGISGRLTSFMKKVGLNPATTTLHVVNSSMPKTSSINNTGKRLLPSPLSLKTNGIDKLIFDKKFGTPRFIKVHPTKSKKSAAILSKKGFTTAAMDFLSANKKLLKISDPQNELKLESVRTDKLGMTSVRFQQVYKGLNVWGKDLYVHLDSHGDILSMNGRFAPTPVLIQSTTPRVSSSTATSIAFNDLKKRTTVTDVSKQLQKLLDYHGPVSKEMIWYDKRQQPHLAWLVEIRSGLLQDWYYFIDANSGEILNSYNNVCDEGPTTATGTDLNGVTRTFGTYQVDTTYYMIDVNEPMFNSVQTQIPNHPVGAIVCLKKVDSLFSYVTSTNNQWNDPAAVSANYNAAATYNFYHTVFGRNSIDDNGMTICSFVHVTQNGQGMDNAFWNPSLNVMLYGDGNTVFKPLAGGLDVAAHEMTHGVTQHTSGLIYQDQSGALNESMSDVMGVLVDSLNWTIGEDVIKDYTDFPTGALRDLSDPHNGGMEGSLCWQPDNMSEYVHTTDNNVGVHKNSGIPNYAFYLVASVIGRDKAGKIWYRAETTYLTRSSQFVDARIATEQSATDLFGSSSNELNAVKNAWDGVGVYEAAPPPPPPSTKLIGNNYILAVNTAPTDPHSIYVSDPGATPIQLSALTSTPVLTKPAVSDTSGLILFVDQNYELRAIYADPDNPQETVLDTNKVWWSVAVGPGLGSIALTSRFIDTTLYYLDLTNNTSKAYKIVTPVYDATNTLNTALYADALSFDPTGRYLIFDTYNQIESITGDTLSYWDINLLDIQSGKMETVFSALSQGESVDDPSFSKTSSTRFTFDYENTNTGKFEVLAADFNTGSVGVIDSTANALGYPSYSGDDKTIVYHSHANGKDYINEMPLNSDLISGTGNSKAYIIGATYPVWFVIGSRVPAGIENEQSTIPQTTLLEQNYPNPFNPTTTIRYQLVRSGHVRLTIWNILGRRVATLLDGNQQQGFHQITFNASHLASGVYFYSLKADDRVLVKKMLLMK